MNILYINYFPLSIVLIKKLQNFFRPHIKTGGYKIRPTDHKFRNSIHCQLVRYLGKLTLLVKINGDAASLAVL